MSEQSQLVPFVPTSASNRHDGWTAERQIAFIEALADSGCVEKRCRPAANDARQRLPAPAP